MNNDYLDNQDKYMYGVYCRDKKDVYERTYHHTIADALSAVPFVKEDSPAKVKIAVCKRGDLFKPSKCNAFDKKTIKRLLAKSNKKAQIEYFSEAKLKLFNLKGEEIQELRKLINDFLDQKIDPTGYYKVGKFIEVITLTREQYTKYL